MKGKEKEVRQKKRARNCDKNQEIYSCNRDNKGVESKRERESMTRVRK